MDVDVPATVTDSVAASAPALALLEFPVTLLDTPAELEAPTAVALCTPPIALLTEGAIEPIEAVAWFAFRAAEYDPGSVRVPTDAVVDTPPSVIDNVAAREPVVVVVAVPERVAVAPTDGDSVPTEAVEGFPVRSFDIPTVDTPDAVETCTPVAATVTD